MKKPFVYAFAAASYIVLIVNVINATSNYLIEENLFMPMTMLGLFVLSVAIMGFLFFYEPLTLFLENKRQEALIFFGKTLGFFASFVLVFSILVFLFQ